jgi:ureidoglycolate lyase
MDVVAERLTQEAFAPYGDVIAVPVQPGREYYSSGLGNARAGARPSLSMVMREPVGGWPLEVKFLERHEFSSQTFVPLDAGRWLVVVCPHATVGGPDVAHARAFIGGRDQGITYRMNSWHHGLTVLDRPGRFVMFMWLDGSSGDEEFVPVTPFTIRLGG